jgi:hypothetical protein
MNMANTREGRSSGKQLLDYSEATKMLRAGATQTEVAQRFGVSQSAVSTAIKRGRIKFDTGFERRLPWHMKPEHVNLAVPRNLRLALRLKAGEGHTMPPYLRQQGEGFIRTLEETGTVIHYEPDVPPYWFRVQRREGIDEGLIRELVDDAS